MGTDRRRCKLNYFLLRMAIEDAGQEAARQEITRQLQGQLGCEVVFTKGPYLNVEFTAADVDVSGYEVEWTDESL